MFRYLANKCSIASRIDCFSEESTTIFGTKLKEQVNRPIFQNNLQNEMLSLCVSNTQVFI